MKLFRYTYIIISLFLLFSCNLKNTEKNDENISASGILVSEVDSLDTYITDIESDTLENDPDFGRYFFRKATNDFFESKLRPNEKLYTDRQYVDTVEYTDFNDDGDYWSISVLKNSTTTALLDALAPEDTIVSTLKKGDRIEIVWEMDSMWISGDGESLWIEEWLTQVKKIN